MRRGGGKKKQLLQVARVWKDEVLRSSRYYARAQSREHHTIDCLQDRGVGTDSVQRSSLKRQERSIVSETYIGTVSKSTPKRLLRIVMKFIRALSSACIPPTALTRTEGKWWFNSFCTSSIQRDPDIHPYVLITCLFRTVPPPIISLSLTDQIFLDRPLGRTESS